MKKHIINLLKGIGIGIANVIPGFSGGTMAVLLKIYDLFIYAFANIFNDFKNVIKKCWSLFLGIILGMLIALVTIVKLLEVMPFITIMFFVGLLIGCIPSMYQKAKSGKIKIIDIVCFVLAIILMVALPLIKTNNDNYGNRFIFNWNGKRQTIRNNYHHKKFRQLKQCCTHRRAICGK